MWPAGAPSVWFAAGVAARTGQSDHPRPGGSAAVGLSGGIEPRQPDLAEPGDRRRRRGAPHRLPGRIASRPCYLGIHAAVFPTFSDERTQNRFRRLESSGCPTDSARAAGSRVRRSGLALGVNFTIQVVPGRGTKCCTWWPDNSPRCVAAGRICTEAAWDALGARRAGLVVAAIEGGAFQQTWRNLGRALDAAIPLVEDGGAIALCCELTDQPGPAVQCLADGPSPDDRRCDEFPRSVRRTPFAAAQVAAALDRADLFICSAGSRTRWWNSSTLPRSPSPGADPACPAVRLLHRAGQRPHVRVTLAKD